MQPLRVIAFSVLVAALPLCQGVTLGDLFPYGELAGDNELEKQDEGATNELVLQTPFVFFGETYFSLFVNINGIISFLTEIPYFFNAQFPLDYPVIAPFYSDVDLTGTGNIYYRETSHPATLQRVSSEIKENFVEGESFVPRSVFLATWSAVGSYQARRDKTNTFQVILTSDGQDSFVIIHYADGGLQWLQGDGKTSGLPDALGQAGLMGADRTLFTIKGSGTDQVRNLDKWSNVGRPGVWMFRVGRLGSANAIQSPNKVSGFPSLEGVASYSQFQVEDTSCAAGGSICHSSAVCNDYDEGFCCACQDEFYGNGISCLPKDKPIRMTGKVAGNVNGIEILDADLHSYVLSADGRTYTAVSRIPKDVGYDLQSLTGIGEGIAWLFATPKEGVPNGFTLTGGWFNRTVKVTFPQTGHSAEVQQTFVGLNVFKNVEVHTEVTGSLPTVPIGSELEVDAFSEEFTRVKSGQLRSRSSRFFKLKGQAIETPYSVETFIYFLECEHAPRNPEFETLRMKVAENIFIRYDEAESVVRYSFSAKVGTLEEEDPCIRGREKCGQNSQCIVDGDSYRCVCEQGYDYVFDETLEIPICLDINECDIGRDQCHVDATCVNSPGSYQCRCRSGYTGDGLHCTPEFTCHNAGCDPNAACTMINLQPECECNVGYKGDGFFCTPDFGDESCHIAQNCSPYAVCAPTADGYACRCLQGYSGDGYTCKVDSLNQENSLNVGIRPNYNSDVNDQQSLNLNFPVQQPTAQPYDLFNTIDLTEVVVPECIFDVCWCKEGYEYDLVDRTCVQRVRTIQDEYESEIESPEPDCHEDSDTCSCPDGFLYNALYGRCDSLSEVSPCNVVNNCHPNAQCSYQSSSGLSQCICNAGFTGNGIQCTEVEVSCDQVNICHFDADCIYDDSQLRSVCVCKPGFAGDGLACTPQDDCNSSSDCNPNAQCQFDTRAQRYACKCNEAYEGDGFYCNPIEKVTCITLQDCDVNADCIYDSYVQNYECKCREGFEGDGHFCHEVEITCNVVFNCGQNAVCAYDAQKGGYKCQCSEGYSGDGFFCRSSHSCLNDPSLCDPNALCQRSSLDEYYHECICVSGYTGDGYTCQEAPVHEKNLLIMNQGLSVLRMPIDPSLGNGQPIHIDPFMTAVGADVDCLEGMYYWTDVGSRSIRTSRYNGKDRRPVISGGKIGSPEDVAIDWVSRNIYWTDSLNDVVSVADTKGLLIKTVIKDNLVNPRGITLHPGLGFIFWSDWDRSDPKIEKAAMDGSERETLVTGQDVSLPNSLVVDFETSTLCWADAGTNRIECIGIQGYGRRVVVQGIKYPFGLTLHKQSFFYTDWNDTMVHEVMKYNGEKSTPRSPPPGGFGKLYGIAAVPEQCPPVSNLCQMNRGNCAGNELCLPNGRGGRSCVAPDSDHEE